MSDSLQDLRDQGWTWREIAAYLEISERTVYRKAAKKRRKITLDEVHAGDMLALVDKGSCSGDPDPAWMSDPRINIAKAVSLRNRCLSCPVRFQCDAVVQPIRVQWDGVCAGQIYVSGKALQDDQVRELFEEQLALFLLSELAHPADGETTAA